MKAIQRGLTPRQQAPAQEAPASAEEAQHLAEEMSDRLLANTVIENYRCVIEPAS